MIIAQRIISLSIIFLALALFFAFKNKISNKPKFYKILSISLLVVFVARFIVFQDAIRDVFNLKTSVFDGTAETVLGLISTWLVYPAMLLAILYGFFPKAFNLNIIKYFCGTIALVALVFLPVYTKSIVGVDAAGVFDYRTILIAIDLALLFLISAFVFIENPKSTKASFGLNFWLCIIGIIIASVPFYTMQAFFGYSIKTGEIEGFNQTHRLFLYAAILLPFIAFVLLRKKDYQTKRLILIFACLATVLSYSLNNKIINFVDDITSLPLHLCNTAMYILPLCLIFKMNKLFYFTYFINVFGAFIAMAIPSYNEANLYSSRVLGFYINHYIAFFMPILFVALRMFERPKIKQFKYSMIAFAFYFVFILFINAWFSNFGECDFFFVNSNFIVSKLGTWAENTMNFVWSFKIGDLSFVFYPFYQLLFFTVYVAIGAATWFVYEASYIFGDTVFDMIDKNVAYKKIQKEFSKTRGSYMLNQKLDKNKIEASLEIINFSKCYGKSKVYSVKDANLKIKAGEVFGFLGHNGAGKSTIIKSIVGIQTITEGNIKVCGFDSKQDIECKSLIGFVPDHYALYEALTGREYVNYIADLYNVSKEDRTAVIDKYVELFSLQTAFDNAIKTYSHGMKQKVTIISALVHNPKIWILDEPLTGLDPVSIFQVKESMREHAKKGNIVFFSSHLIDIVEQLATKIAIINHGKILTCVDVEDVDKNISLEEFYLQTNEQYEKSLLPIESDEKEKNRQKKSNKKA